MRFAVSDEPTVQFVVLDLGITVARSQAKVNKTTNRVAVGSGIKFSKADAAVFGRLQQHGIAFNFGHCQGPGYDIRLHRREFMA